MKKIRKWFFKLLTGYDLIEYEDLLNECWKTIKIVEEVQQTNEVICKHSGEVIDLLKSYLNEDVK